MKPDDRPVCLYQKAVELIDSGHRFATGVVLAVSESTPQRPGARAIFDDAGKVWGTVGGGVAEAEAQRCAVEACASQCPIVLDIDLAGISSQNADAICGGHMRILIDPTAAKDRDAYARTSEALEHQKRGVLCTTITRAPTTQTAMDWCAEGSIPEEIRFPDADAIQKCLSRESAQLFEASSEGEEASTAVLVEPVIPNPVLLIVGGGHIGQALAHQATTLGFDVTVTDDRSAFTDGALYPPGVTTRCGDTRKEVASFPITHDTYVVIVTRGHQHDAAALEACIHTPAAYIGMIGSKRKITMIRKSMIDSGVTTEEEFRRVFAPIGLDIGAITVQEIATSIAAQVVAVRRIGATPPPPGSLVAP